MKVVLEGRVREIARGGEAVVETAEGVVFVAGALPGERVRIGGVARSGGARRGALLEVIEPSPERIEPSCAIAGACGGCPLIHASAASRQQTLAGFVRAALAEGGAAELVPELVAAPSAVGYRRRARLHFDRGRIGYQGWRSRELIDVVRCAVLDDVLAAALERVRATLAPRLHGRGEIRLARGGGRGEAAVVAVVAGGAQPEPVYRACEDLARQPGIAGTALDAGATGTFATFGDPRERTLGADGIALTGTVGGFSQAHEAINRALVGRVAELAEPDDARVLELYAGHGNLSVALACRAASFVAVESDAAASAACRENLRARGMARAEVVTADAASYAAGGAADVVVLDPPRTGARDAIEAIARRKPERIVYVSCDPATLGRDLRLLRERGFVADTATAFDMFPQTAHVESVVRATRSR